MADRPLPEAIRGSWYLLPEEGSPAEALEDDGKLIALRLDGSFSRYALDGARKELEEEGDYTFDGDFLILRARNTETFRVHIEASWHWFLEGKKKSRRLYRGLFDGDERFELSAEERGHINKKPKRVRAKTPFEDETDAIFELIYRNEDNDSRRVGFFSTDTDTNTGALWVGVTPIATNLKAATWEKVIQKAYVDAHQSTHGERELTVELL